MRKIFALAALLAVTATAAEARPSYTYQPMRQAGTLTCAIDPSVGLVFGSTRRVNCTFRAFSGRVVETYVGHMDRAGFDIGVASGQMITWKVWTPGGHARYGMMTGAFSGASSEATVGFGPGTQALFDDRGERIALTPSHQSGQVGLNLAIGATALDLRSARYGARYVAPVYAYEPVYYVR